MTGKELITAYKNGRRDFIDADLSYTKLSGADLSGADLQGTDISDADISGSNLRDADISGAFLSGVDLRGAILSNADISDADISGVNLSGADLRDADLSGAIYKNIKIKELRVFSGLYKYLVMSIIAEDDSEWIRMGCRFRKRVDWNEDFWNNENEFPNNGSYDSELRLYAFKYACDWIDLKKKQLAGENK